MKVWYHFQRRNDCGVSDDEVLTALEAAGLRLVPHDGARTDGAGILFFDEPGTEVFDFLREFSRNGQERVLALAFRHSELKNGVTWDLLRAGASDVFAWEHSSEPAAEAALRFARWAAIDMLVNSALIKENLAGESMIWKRLLRRVVEVARFSDSSILLLGESGTGKELVARLIHTLDTRPKKNELITLDCTTIVPELSGSEFFGHERGSYTGATNERDGAFGLADRGTLFLDEVGELDPRLQAELLRVVQEHTYKRIGSNTWKKTEFRLICATNKDLLDDEGRTGFRRDFFHRIAGWMCVLPPLRERSEDILHLVDHFTRQLNPNNQPMVLDPAVREYLLKREYPGNVRELKALVERMVKRHVGAGPITVGDIAEEERPATNASSDPWRDGAWENAIRKAVSLGVSLKEIGNAATETAISVAVANEGGNLQRAAQKLQVTDRALQLRRAMRRGESKTNVMVQANGDGQLQH